MSTRRRPTARLVLLAAALGVAVTVLARRAQAAEAVWHSRDGE